MERKMKMLLALAFLVTALGFSGLTPQAAGRLKLNKTKVSIVKGNRAKLLVKNTNRKVSWKVSDKKVVSIKGSGKAVLTIKAKKPGKATVTAKVGKKTLKCRITVKAKKAKKKNTKDKKAAGVPYIPGINGTKHYSGSTITYEWVSFPVKETFYLKNKKFDDLIAHSWKSSVPSVMTVEKEKKRGRAFLVLKKAGTSVISCKYKGKTYKWTVRVKDPDARYKAKRAAIYKELGITRAMKDQYKCFLIAKWMCDHITYGKGTNQTNAFHGKIFEGYTICGGYTYIYKYLLDELSIKCICVSSYAKDVNHAWNQVFIDGEWYNVDVTWMDGSLDGKSYNMRNFLVSDEKFGTKRSVYNNHKAKSTRFDDVSLESWLNGDWENY